MKNLKIKNSLFSNTKERIESLENKFYELKNLYQFTDEEICSSCTEFKEWIKEKKKGNNSLYHERLMKNKDKYCMTDESVLAACGVVAKWMLCFCTKNIQFKNVSLCEKKLKEVVNRVDSYLCV